MKKYIIGISLLLLAYNLDAQISYTAADYISAPDSIVVSRCITGLGTFDFSLTSANYSWNYSTLSITDQRKKFHHDPDNAGYRNGYIANCILSGKLPSFCNSQWNSLTDMAALEYDSITISGFQFSNVILHTRTTTPALEATLIGMTFSTTGLTIPYSIKFNHIDTVYHFPFTYNSKDSSRARYILDLNNAGLGITYITNQKRVNVVDGWGSLSTPYKSYSSVLKMKTIIENHDTAIASGFSMPMTVSKNIIYSWWDKLTGIPILEVHGSIKISNNNITITKAQFFDTLRCINPRAGFLYSPPIVYFDTAAKKADVYFTNISKNSNSNSWSFGDTYTSAANSPMHSYKNTGLYNVQLITCNTICEPDRCDTQTIQLIVIDSNTVNTPEFEFQNTAELTVFPNPTDGILNIESDITKGELQLELFDLNGKLVANKVISATPSVIWNIASMNSGVYILRCRSEKSSKIRLIKKI